MGFGTVNHNLILFRHDLSERWIRGGCTRYKRARVNCFKKMVVLKGTETGETGHHFPLDYDFKTVVL